MEKIEDVDYLTEESKSEVSKQKELLVVNEASKSSYKSLLIKYL